MTIDDDLAHRPITLPPTDGAVEAGAPSDAAGDSNDVTPPDGGETPDPCANTAPSCPAAPALGNEGKGLLAVDRCAFRLTESSEWKSAPAIIAAIERITTPATIVDVVRDTPIGATVLGTQAAPAGVKYGFRWNEADQGSTWVPQGLSGSADASPTGLVDGKRVIAVSWAHSPGGGMPELGVRIAFAVAGTTTVFYRFALLAQPAGTPDAPTFNVVDVTAGGIAWYGDYLFVPETERVLRVFDLRHIVRVADDRTDVGCTAGSCGAATHRYVILEVGAYVSSTPCMEKMSFVSVDRSTQPHSLLTGEFCSTTPGSCSSPLAGHLLRWPLASADGKLGAPTIWPSEAFFSRATRVEAVAARKGITYLSASEQGTSKGKLHRAVVDKQVSSDWTDSPGGVMIDEQAGLIWGMTSDAPRQVVAASLANYPPP